METIFDWVSVGIFAGIIVLFLQRSVDENGPQDSIISYFPPSIGCAIANQIGNKKLGTDYDEVIAILLLAGVLAYCWFVLKPLSGRSK